jgi:hypothetical protein
MPSIVFQSSSSEFIKSASDSDFGISSDRKMVAGLCLDAYGSDCSDGALYTSSASFPETYTSDLTIGSIDDTATYDRFVVFNGLGLPMCIGANLKISIDEITPTNSYYGQTLTIATTVTNELDSPYEIAGGNVPVTTAFYIRFVIFNSSSGVVYNSSFPVATTLLPDGTTQYNLSYPVNIRSGQYTVLATVDSSSTVVECNESDNNATSSFNIYSVIIPQIQIDGVNSTAFAYPNVPYWINVSITDSDNNSISNATVQFVEVNGLNINVGTQAYNISDSVSTLAKSGAVGKSIVEVTTNYQGNVSFTYIPTYNQLYDSQYTYLRLSQYVGATQRYMTGVLSNGTSFSFLVNNSITDQYPLTVTNNTYNVTVIQKNILNNLTMVQSFDNIYRTFANFISAFIG